MLPCVCSIIDHRWRQNVSRTKQWHTRRYPSVSLMFLPHFAVLCDLLLKRRTETWNLFVLYNNNNKKKKTYKFSFLFQNLSQLLESRPLPTLANMKRKPFDLICCLYKMKQSHWLLCITRSCDCSWKFTPLSLDSNGFSWNEAELNYEIYKR